MYRSNQPGPARVRAAADQGIRTIINLRGPRSDGGWQLEAEACAKAGITLLDFTARSRAAPDKAMLYATRELFAEAELPAMMHCKSGADRAGLMSACIFSWWKVARRARPLASLPGNTAM